MALYAGTSANSISIIAPGTNADRPASPASGTLRFNTTTNSLDGYSTSWNSISQVPLVTSGLVLSLDAGNTVSYPGSGTTWTDLSGNSNNGTLTNGPTFTNTSGGVIVFDGIDDFVNLGTGYTSMQTQTPTLGLWYKQTSITSYHGVCGWCTWGTGGGFLIDSSGNNNTPTLNIGNGSWASQMASTSSLGANTWAYVVGTYDGSVLRLYVNGELKNSQNLVTSIGYSSKGFAIGRYYGNSPNSFTGQVGLVHMYNRALSASEILQNFNAFRGRYGI